MTRKLKLNLFLLFLLVLLLLLPMSFGLKTEARLTGVFKTLSINGYLHFKVEDYETGWLNSKTKIRVRLNGPLEMLAEATGDKRAKKLVSDGVVLNCNISHGPVIWKGGNGRRFLGSLASCYHGNNLVATIAHDYAGKSRFSVPAVRLKNKKVWGNASLDFELKKLLVALDSRNRLLKVDYDLPLLNLKAEKVGVRAEAVAAKGDYSLTPGGMLIGSTLSTVKLIDFELLGKFTLKLSVSDISAEDRITVNNGKVRYQQNLKVKQIKFDKTRLGPFQMSSYLSGFAEKAVLDFYREVFDGYADKLSMKALNNRMGYIVIRHMSDLLKGSPRFGFSKFSISTPEGNVELSGYVGMENNSQNLSVFNAAKLVPGLVVAKFDMRAGKKAMASLMDAVYPVWVSFVTDIAEQRLGRKLKPEEKARMVYNNSAEMFADAVKKGRFVEIADEYRLSVGYRKGKFMLNGKTRDLPLPAAR